jgi:nucleotide-binding universal stress UspA family protein
MPADTVPPFIESVVHPTDFSPASERAFAHALAIALLRRARLVILHVGNDDDRPDWREFPAVRRTLERWGLLEHGSPREAVFEQFGVKTTKLMLSGGFPARAVVDYLDATPADLLVVATEGRDGATRWLHGSVAEAMARRSNTMTLFVPAHAERSFVSLADGSLTLNNVLIPVDHTPDAGAAVEFARRAVDIGGDGKATISLLHVGAEADMPRVKAEDGTRWAFARMRREGEPVAEIIAAAELVGADLIVMPTAGRAGVFEVLRGSTTERVLRQARCPLLAVPASSGT